MWSPWVEAKDVLGGGGGEGRGGEGRGGKIRDGGVPTFKSKGKEGSMVGCKRALVHRVRSCLH